MSEEAATGVLPPPPPTVDAVAVEVTADSAVAVAEVQTADERAIEQLDKMMKLFMPGGQSADVRVKNSDISNLFKEMDKDNSGALDRDELKAFLQGRYEMDSSSCDIVFNKFDKDGSKSIEKEEFEKIINEVNALVKKFDDEDLKYTQDFANKIQIAVCFQYCCCLCTLCTSHYCAGHYLMKSNMKFINRTMTSGERCKEYVSKGLAQQTMDR